MSDLDGVITDDEFERLLLAMETTEIHRHDPPKATRLRCALYNANLAGYQRGLRAAAAECREHEASSSRDAFNHSRPVYVAQCQGAEEALGQLAHTLERMATGDDD